MGTGNGCDECGVGANLDALVVDGPCSAVLVVPICVYLCVQFPCGEALGDGVGAEGSETMVVVRLVPVGCFLEWSFGLVGNLPVDGNSGSLSGGQRRWL